MREAGHNPGTQMMLGTHPKSRSWKTNLLFMSHKGQKIKGGKNYDVQMLRMWKPV